MAAVAGLSKHGEKKVLDFLCRAGVGVSDEVVGNGAVEDFPDDFHVGIQGQVSTLAGLFQDRADRLFPVFDAGVPVGLVEIGIVVQRGHEAASQAAYARFGEGLGQIGNHLLYIGDFGYFRRGTVSPDGATITGTWQPDPDRPDMADFAYDATMRRIT